MPTKKSTAIYTPDKIKKLLSIHNQGIKLDIGCGANKQPGYIGLDKLDLPGVDVLCDLEKPPWPLPDECASFAFASHVIEHINPANGIFLDFMNEVWRLLKPGAQFAMAYPYAGSAGYWQDPTHCNGCTEVTWAYFDPLDLSKLYTIYRPKPWKIITNSYAIAGFAEVVLEKRKIDKSYGCK